MTSGQDGRDYTVSNAYAYKEELERLRIEHGELIGKVEASVGSEARTRIQVCKETDGRLDDIEGRLKDSSDDVQAALLKLDELEGRFDGLLEDYLHVRGWTFTVLGFDVIVMLFLAIAKLTGVFF